MPKSCCSTTHGCSCATSEAPTAASLVRRGARTPLAREVIARDDVVQFGDGQHTV